MVWFSLRRAFAAAVSILLFGSLSAGIARAEDCSTESSLRAVTGGAPADLLFHNSSSQPRRLYWIGFSGERKPYGTIPAGADRKQRSSVGNHWLVTDESDRCLAIFAASETADTLDIGFSGEYGVEGNADLPIERPDFSP